MQTHAAESLAARYLPPLAVTLKWLASLLLPCLVLARSGAAWADLELTVPDGRRVLLRDDGSWKYQDAPGKDQPKGAPAAEAVLQLMRKIERGPHCRVAIQIANGLPYEIGHIVPSFTAYRANGAVHETANIAFQSIRPSDKLERMVDFNRISCAEIARVQVSGADRCQMGELTKFSEANGQCLARVRVAPSSLTRFDK